MKKNLRTQRPKALKAAPTGRGVATERILSALSEEFPTVHDRESFLSSAALARQFGKKVGGLNEAERTSASRTLGRLISDGAVRESLFLKRDQDRVDHTGVGLVSISINLDRLTQERDYWPEKHAKWQDEHSRWTTTHEGPEPLEPLIPKQEAIVKRIIENTRTWSVQTEYKYRLVLVNISIVHGSSDFDILILVLYYNNDQYMSYIRDVIQRVPFIQKTHTMQIGAWEGFPEIGQSALQSLSRLPPV
jgi:hypothetical protein